MFSIYAKLSSYLLAVRETMAVNIQRIVFLGGLIPVPVIKNLYHIQCQCFDELSSLV